ncbi:hypothetical protein PoB_001023200 [Plakobranchus ocellatus]|uniref:Uncharacterized protein n=1 Tax=Plakobranchus ocellatus TaxID=259542 RepID=A0AAV3YMU6_9GAST|nr:hypothetical protein PoB_001023200 [Plakobranchus ocellatus]
MDTHQLLIEQVKRYYEEIKYRFDGDNHGDDDYADDRDDPAADVDPYPRLRTEIVAGSPALSCGVLKSWSGLLRAPLQAWLHARPQPTPPQVATRSHTGAAVRAHSTGHGTRWPVT